MPAGGSPAALYKHLSSHFRSQSSPLSHVSAILDNRKPGTARYGKAIICANALAGLTLFTSHLEIQVEGSEVVKLPYTDLGCRRQDVLRTAIELFFNHFDRPKASSLEVNSAPDYLAGIYGYTAYGAVELCEKLTLSKVTTPTTPLAQYFFFGLVCEVDGPSSSLSACIATLQGRDKVDLQSLLENFSSTETVPTFSKLGVRLSNLSDEEHAVAIAKGKEAILRGDVFQIVPSRKFIQEYAGDDFQVYQQLTAINPSPYLFYFDLGCFRLFGSSPEAQLVIRDGKAVINPIAGTYQRTGEFVVDQKAVEELQRDPKELAEHIMLVDLARNDLSRFCHPVEVKKFREVHEYSHVIHLVSEVSGQLTPTATAFSVFASTFPAGTVSGAPKHRAMEIIDQIEKDPRGFYAGSIGFFGFDGSVDQGIMIRTFHSENGRLTAQAGSGIVYDSIIDSEINEVSHKLQALFAAADKADEHTQQMREELGEEAVV